MSSFDSKNLEALRREYTRDGLDDAAVLPDPFAQFERWFAQAVAAEVLEPNAMVLATADASGAPLHRRPSSGRGAVSRSRVVTGISAVSRSTRGPCSSRSHSGSAAASGRSSGRRGGHRR